MLIFQVNISIIKLQKLFQTIKFWESCGQPWTIKHCICQLPTLESWPYQNHDPWVPDLLLPSPCWRPLTGEHCPVQLTKFPESWGQPQTIQHCIYCYWSLDSAPIKRDCPEIWRNPPHTPTLSNSRCPMIGALATPPVRKKYHSHKPESPATPIWGKEIT